MACTSENDYLPVRYNLPSAMAGRTYPGTGIITLTVNDAPPVNSLSAVEMTFTEIESVSANLVLSSRANTLVIDDAAAWSFYMPEQILDLSKGVYNYVLDTYSTTGQFRSYVYGTLKLV